MKRRMFWFGVLSWGLVAMLGAIADAEEEKKMSIGKRFHYETSFNERGYVGKEVGWGKQVPLYKTYPDAKKIPLPTPDFAGKCVEEIIRSRKSIRSFADSSLTLLHLSQLLLSADGITHSVGDWRMRAAPSGGALYPIETYVAVSKVEGLEPGLYHFQVSDSSLELIKEGDLNRALHKASGEQDAVGYSPITVVLTARFDRCTAKYGDRGYRYIYLEAGAICENIYLQATSLEMGTVAVGAFNDELLNKLLGIDGEDEAALLIMPVGYPR